MNNQNFGHMDLKIVRYDNRKLYCVTTSNYVTLLDIVGLINQSYNIQVTNHKDKRDITTSTLLNCFRALEDSNAIECRYDNKSN